jgi:hypothetical protein
MHYLNVRHAPQIKKGPDITTRKELGAPRLVRSWLAADLGQAADYTAIVAGQTYAATERTYQRGKFEMVENQVLERTVQSYRVVNAHRPRLGTTYLAIAAQIDAFLEDLPDADLIVDATGVGRGVVDILRTRNLRPIAITHHRRDRCGGGKRIRFPGTKVRAGVGADCHLAGGPAAHLPRVGARRRAGTGDRGL